ncbi:MAG: hypothetical protein ACYDEQ_05525 [Desulfocucumaceae bacterium]
MSWEKIFFLIGLVLVAVFIRSFSDTVRRIVGLALGALFLIMVMRHAPEAIGLVKKYADTLWPVVQGNSERLIDKFGHFIREVSSP